MRSSATAFLRPSRRFALYFNRTTTMRSKCPVSVYSSGTAALFAFASSAVFGERFVSVFRVSCAESTAVIVKVATTTIPASLLRIVRPSFPPHSHSNQSSQVPSCATKNPGSLLLFFELRKFVPPDASVLGLPLRLHLAPGHLLQHAH